MKESFYSLDFWRLDGEPVSEEEDKKIRCFMRALFPTDIALLVEDRGYLLHGYCEWYNSPAKMKTLSCAFPDMIFDLYWESRRDLDASHTYYVEGLNQFCPVKISFDRFDPNKLEK